LGRLKGILEAFASLLGAFGLQLQPWMAPAFLLLVAAALFPMIRRNHRTGRARKLMRQLTYVDAQERWTLERQVLSLVRGDADGLIAVADEALRSGRHSLARAAVDDLRATGRRRQHLRRLEGQLAPASAPTVAEERLAIRNLLAAGMNAEARARAQRARKRWPAEDWSESAADDPAKDRAPS